MATSRNRNSVQTLDIRFDGGLAEDVDADIVDTPILRAVQNADFDKRGSVHFRNLLRVADDTTIGADERVALFTYGDALGAISPTRVYWFDETADVFRQTANQQTVVRTYADGQGSETTQTVTRNLGGQGGFFGTQSVEVLGAGPQSSEEWQTVYNATGIQLTVWNEIGRNSGTLTHYSLKDANGSVIIPATEWVDGSDINVNAFQIKAYIDSLGNFVVTGISREDADVAIQGTGYTIADGPINLQGDLVYLRVTPAGVVTQGTFYNARPVAHYDADILTDTLYLCIQEQVRDMSETTATRADWGDTLLQAYNVATDTVGTASIVFDASSTTAIGGGLVEADLCPTMACALRVTNGRLTILGYGFQTDIVCLHSFTTLFARTASQAIHQVGSPGGLGSASIPTFSGTVGNTDDPSVIPSFYRAFSNAPVWATATRGKILNCDILTDGTNHWATWTGVTNLVDPGSDTEVPHQVHLIRFDEASLAAGLSDFGTDVTLGDPYYFHSSAQIARGFVVAGTLYVPYVVASTGPQGFNQLNAFPSFGATPSIEAVGAPDRGASLSPNGFLMTIEARENDFTNTYFTHVGRFLTDEACFFRGQGLKSVSVLSDVVTFAADILGSEDQGGQTGGAFASVSGKAISLDFNNIPSQYFLETQDKTVFSVGKNFFWDGQRMNDLTPLTSPIFGEKFVDSASTLPTAIYCWTYVDSKGRRHRSTPVPVYGAAPHTLYQPPPFSAMLDALLMIEVYAPGTVTGDTSNFYLVNTYNYEATSLGFAIRTSTPSIEIPSGAIGTPDTSADADFTSAPLLYTTGGIQSRDSVPNLYSIIKAGRRLWGISSDNPERIYYSSFIDDNSQVAWNNGNFVTNPGLTVNAIANLDEQVVAFTEDQIAVVYGQGPNNAGSGSSFILQDIVTDTGCTNAAGVVTTDLGIFFPGRRGIYLLPRGGGSPQFVGGPIEDSLSVGAIQQGILHSKKQVILWATGTTWFVYHYAQGVWGTWNGNDVQNVKSMVIWKDKLCYLDAGNDLYIENPDAVASDLVLETAELKLTGLRGFRRLKETVLHGRVSGAPDSFDFVFMQMAHDYNSTFGDPRVFTGASFDTNGRIKLRHKPQQQKAPTTRIRIEARSQSNTTDYFFSGITLAVASKGTEQKTSRTSP